MSKAKFSCDRINKLWGECDHFIVKTLTDSGQFPEGLHKQQLGIRDSCEKQHQSYTWKPFSDALAIPKIQKDK